VGEGVGRSLGLHLATQEEQLGRAAEFQVIRLNRGHHRSEADDSERLLGRHSGGGQVNQDEARQILEVGPDDPPERIKDAYREQLKHWHPDLFTDDAARAADAALRTRRIVAAYRSLAGVASPTLSPPEGAGPEPFEEPFWNQWNPFHPSHDRYGPNTLRDRLAIAGVVIVALVLLIIFGR
jgi:hypothetical protein